MLQMMKKIALLAMVLVAGSVLAAAPSVKVGVVAQRYPWNGMVDVTVKVADAEEATLTLFVQVPGGDKIQVAKKEQVSAGEQTISFDANAFDALKGKQLKGVKVTAEIK